MFRIGDIVKLRLNHSDNDALTREHPQLNRNSFKIKEIVPRYTSDLLYFHGITVGGLFAYRFELCSRLKLRKKTHL